MSAEKVEFRKVDGDVYVLRTWPRVALIPRRANGEMLPDTVIVNGHIVTVGCKNGFASYGVQRVVGDDLLCVKGESEFLGLPTHVK